MNEDKMVEQLKKSLAQLDESVPLHNPDLHWIELKMKERKQQLRRTLLRDLFLLWIVAALIFSVCVAMVYHVPLVFVILQVILVISIPFVVISQRKKQVTL